MQTVVETPSYLADAERLFSPEERLAIVDRLAADPRCGVVIPGSGGIWEVRFGVGARGKSGGDASIFLFFVGKQPALFFGAFLHSEEHHLPPPPPQNPPTKPH